MFIRPIGVSSRGNGHVDGWRHGSHADLLPGRHLFRADVRTQRVAGLSRLDRPDERPLMMRLAWVGFVVAGLAVAVYLRRGWLARGGGRIDAALSPPGDRYTYTGHDH